MSDEENDSWTCPACTLKNELMVEACAACGATSPLVLQSYAIEEQARANGEGVEGRRSQAGSFVSQGSDNATPRGDDDEMDPWAQAECEWAHVEARQDSRSRNDRVDVAPLTSYLFHYNGLQRAVLERDYVRVGDADGVIKRLDAGDSIEERRSSNYTPLINAAYYNKCEMIELLLDKGADIEAVDKSGLSALRTAIYYRKEEEEEAAVLLATRGADANKIAYQQTTALHAAVKDGQLAVVRALLLGGADLTIDSADIDLISGDNVEELKTLLMNFKSLEMALETESGEAVGVLLKKTLSERDTADDALIAYKTATAAAAKAEGDWQTELLQLVEQFEVDMLNRAAHSGSTAFVDAIHEAIGKPEWVSSASLDAKGSNVLHVATSQGHVDLVIHLLTNYDCDSVALDSEGNKASDLVSENEDENSKHIH